LWAQRFQYEVESFYPPNLINTGGKKYIIPTWQTVHPKTTIDDLLWIKPKKQEPPIEKEIWKFKSSDGESEYFVRKTGNKYICSCPGFWRAKDRNLGCKHIQQIKNNLK
jgi:hypothetical protein